MSERLMMPTTNDGVIVANDETGRSRTAATSVPNSVESLCASSVATGYLVAVS